MRRTLIKYFPRITLQLLYLKTYGRFFDVNNPVSFYEKLIWLNYYEKNHLKSMCTDKFMVRKYLQELGLNIYLNKLYGYYQTTEEIDFSALPDKFILKCTHGSRFNIICEDRNKFDIPKAIKNLNRWLKKDYSHEYAELQYKTISPAIICEEYLGSQIMDYKVYCFNGAPAYIMICTNPSLGEIKYYLYDFNWNYQIFLKKHINDPHFKKPINLNEIFTFSQTLSKGFNFVRVDFYIVKNQIIFGEMTFTPSGFMDNQTLPEFNNLMGKMLRLES